MRKQIIAGIFRTTVMPISGGIFFAQAVTDADASKIFLCVVLWVSAFVWIITSN